MEIDMVKFNAQLDLERRMKLVEKATDGMEDVRAIEFLLNSMQDHVHRGLSSRSERSNRQDGLIFMISDWERELKSP